MSVYRIYTLTAGGHILEPPIIAEHQSDSEATLSAIGLSAAGLAVEVWEGARLVCCMKGGQADEAAGHTD